MIRIRDYKKIILLTCSIAASVILHFLNPFALAPVASGTISIGFLMVVLWLTELLPLPVVALLPMVLFPLAGIQTLEDTARSYSNPVIFLFFGGFMLALAIEKWDLHKRVALHIVRLTGTSGNRIILGFILATGFLSMWLSNTATTMMMFPIAYSVVLVMQEHEKQAASFRNFSIVLILSVAYASNIGGMGTLIGTPPNMAFAAFYEKKYGLALGFLDWMLVAMPMVIAMLFGMYLLFTRVLFPNRIRNSEEAHRYISTQLEDLGPFTPAQKRVLLVFGLTALSWILKDLLKKWVHPAIDDNLIALAGAILLFIVPSGSGDEKKGTGLLNWNDTGKMAWGILLLFGGGIALAGALEKAGIMTLIGQWMAGFGHLDRLFILALVVLVSIFLSELMSNVAQVIVLSPVICALAGSLNMDPLLLGIPMTLGASVASMLPMGTPPNAIVFSSGLVPMRAMLKAGLALNLLGWIVVTLASWFLLPWIMGT